MKKFLLSLVVCLSLAGCANQNLPLDQRLAQIVSTNLTETPLQSNHSKKNLKYYVPKNIGVIDQAATSTVFKYDNVQFLMSINVAAIISNGSFSYRSPLDLSNAVYSEEGDFINVSNESVHYVLSLLPLDGKYYIVLNSDYLSFYGYANEIDCIAIVDAMTTILRNATIIKDKIIENFDREEAQKSEKIALDIFNEVIPGSGRLEDLVDGDIPEASTPVETISPTASPSSEDDETDKSDENIDDMYLEEGDISQVSE